MSPELKEKLLKINKKFHDDYELFDSMQMSTKILINSIYGAFGAKFFYFFNMYCAQSITRQGKHSILYAENAVNEFFRNEWLKRQDIMQKMGTTRNQVTEIHKPVSVYIDTDSIYQQYDEVMRSTHWMDYDVWDWNNEGHHKYVSTELFPTLDDARKYFGDETITEHNCKKIKPTGKSFVLTLDKVFTADFFKKLFLDLADVFGVENTLDFELESYASAGIWLAKKKYVQSIEWTDPDVHYEPLSYIKPKGIELATNSMPKWCKGEVKGIVKWFFEDENSVNAISVGKKLADVKRKFKLQPIPNIVITKNINQLEKYVLPVTVQNLVAFQPKAPAGVQGAALYNNYIKNNKDLKQKYELVHNGMKVSMYYCKPLMHNTVLKYKDPIVVSKNKIHAYEEVNGNLVEKPQDKIRVTKEVSNVFAFPPGNYPIELSDKVPVDYDTQFDKLIIAPIQRMIDAIGIDSSKINLNQGIVQSMDLFE